MRKILFTTWLATLALCFNTALFAAPDKQDKAAKKDLDEQTSAVNKAADKGDKMQMALHNISIETGVPLAELQSMHQHHKDVGAGGLLNACVLADNTKRTPEDFVKQHESGKSWAAMARDNNVPIEKLTVRLDRVEQYLKSGTQPTGRESRRDRNRF